MTLVDGPEPGATEVKVWDLEMTSLERLQPGREPDVEPVLLVARQPAPELCRFFYQVVGGPWHWVDQVSWPPERWQAWCDRPELHFVSCWVDGVPAGYYEFDVQGHSAEIVHFGLTERFFGHGLGGWLLTDAVTRGFEVEGIERVWLHTCSLDGPAALANYRARGFEQTSESTEWRRLTAAAKPAPGEIKSGEREDFVR